MNVNQKVYLCYTPYHILLAIAMAINSASKNNVLIITKDWYEADKFINIIKPIYSKFNINILYEVEGVYINKKKAVQSVQSLYLMRSNALSIIKFLSDKNIKCIYTFNDRRPDAQIIINKYRNKVDIKYIEDGSNAYSDFKYTRMSSLKKFIYSIVTIGNYEEVQILGMHNAVNEIFVVYPERIREDLKTKKGIHKIPVENLLKKDFIDPIKKELETYLNRLNKIDFFIIAPFIDNINFNKIKKWINKIIDKDENGAGRGGIKFHPRNNLLDFNHMSLVKFPNFIPIELLLIILRGQLRKVYTKDSTSTLSTEWIIRQKTYN